MADLDPGARKLLVVADDFGLDAAIDRAAMELIAAGAVSLASLIVNGPSASAITLCRDLPAVGLHMNLSEPCTRPLTGPHLSVCLADGRLAGREVAWGALANADHSLSQWLEREIGAQLDLALSAGPALVHVCSHHHVHALPAVASALVAACAARQGSPGWVRGFDGNVSPDARMKERIASAWPEARKIYRRAGWRMTRLAGFLWMAQPSIEALQRDLAIAVGAQAGASPEPGDVEWMVHPACGTGAAALSLAREAEYRLLRDPSLWSTVTGLGFRVQSCGASRSGAHLLPRSEGPA